MVTAINSIDIGRSLGPLTCDRPFPFDVGVYANCSGTIQIDSADTSAPMIVLAGSYSLSTNGPTVAGGIPAYYVSNTNGPPLVLSIAPTHGTIIGGTSVTITGSNFAIATDASIDGQPIADFQVLSDTQIRGTVPRGSSVGAKDIVVRNPFGSTVLNFAYTYDPPTLVSSPAEGALPSATGGTAYSQAFTTSGGTDPYTYSVQSGNLPAGMALSSGGTLSGTPTSGGMFNFTIRSTDGMGFTKDSAYSLTVAAPPIVVSPASLPSATAGVAYSQTLTASGSNAPYTFSIEAGTLPAGMAFSSGGVLSGTPSAAGSYTFTARATDQYGFSGSRSYTLAVYTPSLVITPVTLPNATAGVTYSQTLTASGGTSPYTFSLRAGSLPPGTAFSSGGVLSGTPTTAGSYSFTVRATDDLGFFIDQNYTVAVSAPSLVIAPASLPSATGGVAYSQTLTVSGGTSPYTFSLRAGSLPPGMALSSAGAVSGTPTTAGSYTFTVRATDDFGFFVDQDYTIAIGVPSLTIAPASLPNAIGGVAYSQTLTPSGGTSPYTFSLRAGSLPPGVAFSSAGAFSGTPTTAGSYAFTVRATDNLGFFIDQNYMVAVGTPSLAIAPASLPNATGGVAYSQTLTASGGTSPYAFSLPAGSLPPGMTLSSGGVLSGTPTAAGSYSFTVRATDQLGFFVDQGYSVVIDPIVPVARNRTLQVMSGATATVNLTEEASGGPFTAAALITPPPASQGSATISGGPDYKLIFTATGTASGVVALSYTLSNAWTTSAPATITVEIVARPDPSRDSEVIGLVNAQIDSARRFATAQTQNFQRRLEQLHDERSRHANSVNIQLGETGNDELGYRQEMPESPALSALGYAVGGDRTAGAAATKTHPHEGAWSDLAVWSGGFVDFGSREKGAVDLSETLVGVSGGVDYRFSKNFVGGVGIGYGHDAVDVGTNGTSSEGKALSAALYGSYSPQPRIFLDGLLGYSRLDFDSRRFVTDTGDFAEGQRNGQQVFGSLSLAYEHRAGSLLLSPYASMETSWSQLDGFDESGAGLYNLTYGDQSTSAIAGVLGLKLSYSMPADWGVFTPRGRLEYTHDFSGSSRATLGYADVPGPLPYGFDTDIFSRDYLGLEIGFDAEFNNSWLIGMDYRTAFGFDGNSQDHTIGIKISTQFH